MKYVLATNTLMLYRYDDDDDICEFYIEETFSWHHSEITEPMDNLIEDDPFVWLPLSKEEAKELLKKTVAC